jgi:hypothetical protein
MWRNVLAVITGLIVTFIVIMLVEGISGSLYPPPEGMDWKDTEAMKAHVMNLPTAAFLLVIAAHVLGLLIGGYFTARIATSQHMVLATVVGGLVLVGGIFNLMQVPHPDWFWVELLLYLPAAWLGAKLGISKAAA